MGSSVKGSKRSAPADNKVNKKAKHSSSKKAQPIPEPESASESEESADELDFSSSEDELDNVSNDEDEEVDELDQDEIKFDEAANEDEDDEDNEEIKERDPNKQTSSEAHQEQRKMLQERKLQRKSGVQVQHIKSLWERLRVKNPPAPKEIRDKLCDEIWKYSKDVIRDLVLKHDASRVVQTLVKYSDKERREAVVLALKSHFYELATSSYGKYLLVKLLHYGSKNSRDLILSELHGKLRKLMRHREGAYVVEDLYVLYSTAEQKQQMIREFWGAEYAVFKDSGKGKTIKEVCDETVEKRNLIAKNLQGTITASVEKGSTGFQILHAAMREYIQIINDEEARELIELLQDQFAELIHTPEGSEVACTLIAKATAKERKGIVKALRDHAVKLIENEYGNLVLITLFLTVDDVVLISKAFLPEYSEKLPQLVIDKYARRPFLYLLNGLDGRFFSPIVKEELNKYVELSKNTSKKPQEQRKSQLLEQFAPTFYQNIIDHTADILSENKGSQFVAEVFSNNAPASEELKEQAISAVIEAFKGPIDDKEHLINGEFSGRLLKSLIQDGKWNPKEKKLIKLNTPGLGSKFAKTFYNDVIGYDLENWISNKNTSFIIVNIFESIEDKNSAFFKDLKKLKSVIKGSATDGSNKGAQLLAKLLAY